MQVNRYYENDFMNEKTVLGNLKTLESTISNIPNRLNPLGVGIIASTGVGGASAVAMNLAHGMTNKGHNVHVIAYKRPFHCQRNVHFHSVKIRKYNVFDGYFPVSLVSATKIKEVVAKYHIDVLNPHYIIPHAVSAYFAKQMCAAQRQKVPLITTVHGTDVHTIGLRKEFREIVKFTIECSDGAVSICEFLANQLRKKYDIDREIKIIPNFVDEKRYSPPEKRMDGPKNILHVSNFRQIKRIDDIVSAYKIISESSDARLILVGDGPEMPRIRKMVNKLKIKNVIFTGKRKNVVRYYQKADVFLMASRLEGMPLSMLEAMSCGVPVVSSAVGGIPEIVNHGKNGYLTRLGDCRSMAEYCLKLLGDDKIQKNFSKRSRKSVLKNFSFDKAVREYERYFRKISIL